MKIDKHSIPTLVEYRSNNNITWCHTILLNSSRGDLQETYNTNNKDLCHHNIHKNKLPLLSLVKIFIILINRLLQIWWETIHKMIK